MVRATEVRNRPFRDYEDTANGKEKDVDSALDASVRSSQPCGKSMLFGVCVRCGREFCVSNLLKRRGGSRRERSARKEDALVRVSLTSKMSYPGLAPQVGCVVLAPRPLPYFLASAHLLSYCL